MRMSHCDIHSPDSPHPELVVAPRNSELLCLRQHQPFRISTAERETFCRNPRVTLTKWAAGGFDLLRIIIPALLLAGSAIAVASARPEAPAPPAHTTIEEARAMVSMLADFYRENLLLTHKTYVDGGRPPAALVTKTLFKEMKEKGWPETRWLSTNSHPLNRENLPRDTFERSAARKIRAGEKLVETVDGNRYRAVTAVPFTGTCLKCHWGDKPSDYVGGISFLVNLSASRGAAK